MGAGNGLCGRTTRAAQVVPSPAQEPFWYHPGGPQSPTSGLCYTPRHLGSCPCTRCLGSGRESLAGSRGMAWRNSKGAGAAGLFGCEVERWERGRGETKPGFCHRAQEQAGAPLGSALHCWSKVGGGHINLKSWSNVLCSPDNTVILNFNCSATPTPKVLMQVANRANTYRIVISWAGHCSPSQPQHRNACPGLTRKHGQDMKASRANGVWFNGCEAFRVLNMAPEYHCVTSHVPRDAWWRCPC